MRLFEFVQKRFGGGWSRGRSHHSVQFQKTVGDRKPSAVLNDVAAFAKRWDIRKRTALFHHYEHPTDKRTRLKFEKAYFAKWHYLKYCSRMINFGLGKGLLLGSPLDITDEMQLKRKGAVGSETVIKPDGLSKDEVLSMAKSFYGKVLM